MDDFVLARYADLIIRVGLNLQRGQRLLILGPIVVRVNCEIFIVLFRINDNLADIRNHVLSAVKD